MDDTNSAEDDEQQTFEIAISGLTAKQIAELLGTMNLAATRAATGGKDDNAKSMLVLQDELMRQNADACRHALLETDILRAKQLSEQTKDVLGIEVGPEGEILDAENYTEIDID